MQSSIIHLKIFVDLFLFGLPLRKEIKCLPVSQISILYYQIIFFFITMFPGKLNTNIEKWHFLSSLEQTHHFRYFIIWENSFSKTLRKINPNTGFLWLQSSAWKVSKYGVFSVPYFPAFGLNTERYGPEKTPYLDTFQIVTASEITSNKYFC